MDFRETTVSALVASVKSRERSAREVVAAALTRIDGLNPSLNAFVALDHEAALRAADEVDAQIARGEDPGPLAGMPLGVKDVEDARGFRTTLGSAVNAQSAIAEQDSSLVARLKAAGCVVTGKTNMPEFGLKPTSDNPTFGASFSPWGQGMTPGGSSGGSSAAVAAGMVPLATASDGGGSIRIPSSVTGLSGFKPTPGHIPSADRSAPGWPLLSSKGVLATNTADVTLALEATRGLHPLDLRSFPASPGSWVEALHEELPRLRIAWSPTLGYANEVDTEIVESCEALLGLMEAEGHTVERLDVGFAEDPGRACGTLVGAYMSRTIAPYRGTELWKALDPGVVLIAELTRLTVTAEAVVGAIDASHRLNVQLEDAMQGFDLLMSPTTNGQTPPAEMRVPSQMLVALIAATPELLGDISDAVRDQLIELVSGYETINLPAGTINGVPSLDWCRMTQGFNLAATPAGTVCSGLTSGGMPIGLQLAASRHNDVLVLRAMQLLERLRGPVVWPG